MFHFLQNQILFYTSLALVLFLPGYFLLRAVFARRYFFSQLETLVLSVGASIIVTNFLMLSLGAAKIAINRLSVLVSIIVSSLVFFAIAKLRERNLESLGQKRASGLSEKHALLVGLILLLAVFIRVGYLKYNSLPATTDLGHHMYWSQSIVDSGRIPNYAARDIEVGEEKFSLGDPRPISDFIVGEHLIFAALSLISGIKIVSFLPTVMLYLINLAGLLMIFVLTLRFFESDRFGRGIAVMALFFSAALFAVAPPQAKYVGGGVIGNLIGNFLLPASLFFVLRAWRENKSVFLVGALFFAMGLFYTHHLTGLMLLLVLLPAILLILALNLESDKDFWIARLKLIFSPAVIAFVVMAAAFLFFVYTPTYLTNRAVDTVVGGPAKIEHTGLSYAAFKAVVGEPRAALGLIGIAFLIFVLARKGRSEKHAEILLLSWVGILMLISLQPAWVGLSIPSARVANYASYPLAIIAALVMTRLWTRFKIGVKDFANSPILVASFMLLVAFAVTFGIHDNAQYAVRSVDAQKTIQTFSAAKYLLTKTNSDDRIVTDHIYVTSDSWIKLFFMRDYNFPFYRANLERYTNKIDKKEFCTLWMINDPKSPDSQKCFTDLGINFALVNAKFDGAQFESSKEFWKIYSDGELSAFYRP